MEISTMPGTRSEYSIYIDDSLYKVNRAKIDGVALRKLASLASHQDIWQVIPGPDNDKLIGLEDIIELRSGMQFFTAKKMISPRR